MPYPLLLEILTFVSQRRGIDFRDYRRDMLRRRAQSRVRATGSGFEMIASDLDRRSLEVARAGAYPAAAAVGIPHELYPRYFRSNGSGIRIADSLRDRIQFAQHDLVGPYLAPQEAIVAAF